MEGEDDSFAEGVQQAFDRGAHEENRGGLSFVEQAMEAEGSRVAHRCAITSPSDHPRAQARCPQ